MDRTIDATKYFWTEHVTPQLSTVAMEDEDMEMQQCLEEYFDQEPRKITHEEAARKQVELQQINFGFNQGEVQSIEEQPTDSFNDRTNYSADIKNYSGDIKNFSEDIKQYSDNNPNFFSIIK